MSAVRMFQLIQKANTALNENEAEELVNEFEKLIYQRFDDRKELLATKVDLAETKADIVGKISDTATALDSKMNRIYRSLLMWIVIMGILNVVPEILETIFRNL